MNFFIEQDYQTDLINKSNTESTRITTLGEISNVSGKNNNNINTNKNDIDSAINSGKKDNKN